MSTNRKTISQIMRELYIALECANAPLPLLAAVGSFDDTLTDDEILEMLEAYNYTNEQSRP